MENLEHEFLNTLASITKLSITPSIWKELHEWYPERYKSVEMHQVAGDILTQASHDYYTIMYTYLNYDKIPITMETLTAGYLAGVRNLKKYGLVGMTKEIKTIMGLMRVKLQPEAEQLDTNIKY